jgi:polyvinyl alcohol dehydrogenase (cytochrome)
VWRRRHALEVRSLGFAGVALMLTTATLAGCGTTHTSARASLARPALSAWDWPTYGHDAQHTFNGKTTLTKPTAKKLKQAWFFRTADAVTATPTVVGGTVFAGSWDDYFYAVNLETGRLRWKYQLSDQNAITPYPGQHPRDTSSDGGLVTSSAWYEPASGTRPDLVIFGGGFTLYALNAQTGKLYWRHDYTGRPDRPPDPNKDGTRIFSSPVVADGKVIFGVDVDGARGYGGYVMAANVETGDPVWDYRTDTNTQGRVLDDGCGSVWSSGTVMTRADVVVFDTADCDFSNSSPLSESVFALHITDGNLAWAFRPPRADDKCDLDFGATPNGGLDTQGNATFLGVGGKDGSYYSLDPNTGRMRWHTNVVFGGFSGGFIATAAYDGTRVYGSTAIGDFGRFERSGNVLCDPSDPRDLPMQDPSVHAFASTTGTPVWQAPHAASFSPTTVAGGMTFNGPALTGPFIQVRDATTGTLINQLTVPAANWSGIATVGNALVMGVGTTYDPSHAGIAVVTPNGLPPVVPSSP